MPRKKNPTRTIAEVFTDRMRHADVTIKRLAGIVSFLSPADEAKVKEAHATIEAVWKSIRSTKAFLGLTEKATVRSKKMQLTHTRVRLHGAALKRAELLVPKEKAAGPWIVTRVENGYCMLQHADFPAATLLPELSHFTHQEGAGPPEHKRPGRKPNKPVGSAP